jgi:hypothetical protein
LNFLFVSAFSEAGKESGANRLRKLRYGLEHHLHSVSWLNPIAAGSVIGKKDKILALGKMLSEIRRWKTQNPEGFVLISLPPPWLLLIAAVVAISEKKLLLDFRDPIQNSAINPRGKLYQWCLGFLERFAISRSKGVIFAAPKISQHLLAKPSASQTILAGIDPREVSENAENRQPNVLYGGTFYASRNPWPLLRALKNYKGKIAFHFRVEGLEEKEIIDIEKFLSENELLSRITFSNLVPRKQFMQELQQSKVALIITHAQGSDYAIPGKIFDYVSAGCFLWVQSEDSGLLEFLEEYKVPALVVKGWEESEILQSLDKLESLLATSQGLEMKKAADRLSCVRQAQQLEKFCLELDRGR